LWDLVLGMTPLVAGRKFLSFGRSQGVMLADSILLERARIDL
jgi:hypothetical protein